MNDVSIFYIKIKMHNYVDNMSFHKYEKFSPHYIVNIEKLSDFIEQKEKAIKEGKKNVQWEDVEIPLEDAEKFIKTAKKQFENPKVPVKREEPDQKEVLIIKENEPNSLV